MSTFKLPVSGYQVTLKETLKNKVYFELKNFAVDRMRHVESSKELDEDGNPVREVVFPGNITSQLQDFTVISFLEKMVNGDQELPCIQKTIDDLDAQDGELLWKKVQEAYSALKKKLGIQESKLTK